MFPRDFLELYMFPEYEEGNIMSNPTDVIEKTKVGHVLLGDGGYPLK